MNRRSIRALAIAFIATAFLIGAYILFARYAARKAAESIGNFLHDSAIKAMTAAQPFLDADFIISYVRTDDTFKVSSLHPNVPDSRIPHSELLKYIASAKPESPRLAVILSSEDFPLPTDQEIFKTQLRDELRSLHPKLTFSVVTRTQSSTYQLQPLAAPPGN